MEILLEALLLIVKAESSLLEIVGLSLLVSLSATALALLLALPLAALLALISSWLSKLIVTVSDALLATPTVVIGLVVYLALSRNGPLGFLQLLYSVEAMIMAQTILIFPIILSLSYNNLRLYFRAYRYLFATFGISHSKRMIAALYDNRYSLLHSLAAAFGRALGEVGTVLIVGGNIEHYTRVMSNAIVLETAKGELGRALALGIVLLILALLVNTLLAALRWRVRETDF